MTEHWQQDLTPPVSGDRERTPFDLLVALVRDYASSIGTGRIISSRRSQHDFVLMPPPITGGRPRPAIKEKRPYQHDPPTNRIYPTSFDSWCNEYDRPIKSSQVRHNRSRRMRRR